MILVMVMVHGDHVDDIGENDHVNDIGDGDHVDDIGDGDHVDVTVMVMVRQETALVGPWCIERQ